MEEVKVIPNEELEVIETNAEEVEFEGDVVSTVSEEVEPEVVEEVAPTTHGEEEALEEAEKVEEE